MNALRVAADGREHHLLSVVGLPSAHDRTRDHGTPLQEDDCVRRKGVNGKRGR
jgi:hypothetical protein